MHKLGTALAATIVAAASALVSQEPREAAARPAIAFAGDMITSLQVKDVKAAAKWYHDVLGCELALDLSDIGWCEVSTPAADNRIGLGLPEEGAAVQTNGGSKVSFGVADIEAARALLKSKGVQVGEIIEIPDTVKLLELVDPDGNGLMLHQALAR